MLKTSDIKPDRHPLRQWRYVGQDMDGTDRATPADWTGIVHPGITFGITLVEPSHVKVCQLARWDCLGAGAANTRVYSYPYDITGAAFGGEPGHGWGNGGALQTRYLSTGSTGVFENVPAGARQFGLWLITPDHILTCDVAMIIVDICKA